MAWINLAKKKKSRDGEGLMMLNFSIKIPKSLYKLNNYLPKLSKNKTLRNSQIIKAQIRILI